MQGISLEDAKLTCEKFSEYLANEDQHQPVLILDLRSFLVYNQSHIKNSINICIPKTLAKRDGFSTKTMESGICKKPEKDLFKQRKGSVIVLYDQNGCEKDQNGVTIKSFEALMKEGVSQHVYYLEGGFAKFQKEYPNLVRTIRVGGGILRPIKTLKTTTPLSAPALITAPELQIVQICDYLFLSGYQAASDYELLKQHQIKYILNAAVELEDYFHQNPEFIYKRLELRDCPNQHICIKNVFEQAFAFIDEARNSNSRVLVHCRGGRSRSVTIVIAYLMKTNNWTLTQAYDLVQSKNPLISPNLGFMGQLLYYESILQKGYPRLDNEQQQQEQQESSDESSFEASLGGGSLTNSYDSSSSSSSSNSSNGNLIFVGV